MKKFFPVVFAIILALGNTLHARVIIDTEGRKVELPEKVERVVVLTAVCIEVIYICGKIDKVVGISGAIFRNPVYRKIIKGLEDIPVISQTGSDINIEKLLAVKPQLVIALGGDHPARLPRDMVERIESFGIPVVLVNVRSLKENYRLIKLIGEIFKEEKKANELVYHMKNIVQKVKKETQRIPKEKRVKVMKTSGDSPTFVAGNYWGDQDIRVLAGSKLVPDDIRQFFAVISLERMISLNPDVILISHLARYSPEDILQNPQLKNIRALQNKRVYKNPYQIGGLFTPRVVLLLAWTAKKLYPEIDIDWMEIADDFFKRFYGIPYYGGRK